MVNMSGQAAVAILKPGVKRIRNMHCRSGEGFVVDNLLLISRKITSTFVDA